MGLMSKREVFAAEYDFVKECYAIEEEFDTYFGLPNSTIRVEDEIADFDSINEADNVDQAFEYLEKANCTVEKLTSEEFMDGVINCEGELYEILYYYEGYGSVSYYGKEITKALYNRLSEVLSRHGFELDLTRPGSIMLMSRESIQAQLKRDLKDYKG